MMIENRGELEESAKCSFPWVARGDLSCPTRGHFPVHCTRFIWARYSEARTLATLGLKGSGGVCGAVGTLRTWVGGRYIHTLEMGERLHTASPCCVHEG